MKITFVESEPVTSFSAVNVGRGGLPERIQVPVLKGKVDQLPGGLECLMLTGDLQFHDRVGRNPEDCLLFGTVVAEEMAQRAEKKEFPDPDRTGVLLAVEA